MYSMNGITENKYAGIIKYIYLFIGFAITFWGMTKGSGVELVGISFMIVLSTALIVFFIMDIVNVPIKRIDMGTYVFGITSIFLAIANFFMIRFIYRLKFNKNRLDQSSGIDSTKFKLHKKLRNDLDAYKSNAIAVILLFFFLGFLFFTTVTENGVTRRFFEIEMVNGAPNYMSGAFVFIKLILSFTMMLSAGLMVKLGWNMSRSNILRQKVPSSERNAIVGKYTIGGRTGFIDDMVGLFQNLNLNYLTSYNLTM